MRLVLSAPHSAPGHVRRRCGQVDRSDAALVHRLVAYSAKPPARSSPLRRGHLVSTFAGRDSASPAPSPPQPLVPPCHQTQNEKVEPQAILPRGSPATNESL